MPGTLAETESWLHGISAVELVFVGSARGVMEKVEVQHCSMCSMFCCCPVACIGMDEGLISVREHAYGGDFLSK